MAGGPIPGAAFVVVRRLATRPWRGAIADGAQRRGEPDARGDVRGADDAPRPDVLPARRRAREGGPCGDGREPRDANAVPGSSSRRVRVETPAQIGRASCRERV